jgi:hypothetical protein
MMLLATAVDAEGRYGEIAKKAYSTLPYTFSDVTLNLSIEGDPVYGYNNFVVTSSDPTAITEYRIRLMVNEKIIPFVSVGNRKLVNMDDVWDCFKFKVS